MLDIVAPCPARPDIDCIGGAVAYCEFITRTTHKAAKAWICGKPDGGAQFYLDRFSNDLSWATDEEAFSAKNYALIDFSNKVPLPEKLDRQRVSVIIDHHFHGDAQTDFPNALIQLEIVGAAATLVTELFMERELLPSAASAAMLLGGIHSNTFGLRSTLTNARDQAAFAWLTKLVPEHETMLFAQDKAHKNAIMNNLAAELLLDAKAETSSGGLVYLFSQLEFAGALEQWQSRSAAIKTIVNAWGKPSILNLIDTTTIEGLIYSNHEGLLSQLAKGTGSESTNDYFFLRPALQRKQLKLFIS